MYSIKSFQLQTIYILFTSFISSTYNQYTYMIYLFLADNKQNKFGKLSIYVLKTNEIQEYHCCYW